MRISYANVFGLGEAQEPREPVVVGDLVATGRNGHPRYTVLAIVDDKAWIRGLNLGRDHVVPVRRLRKLPSTSNPDE